MTRKIVTLVSLIALLFSANKVKAQNEDNYYRESKTIYQGEGYWLNNYIYLVSEEKAKEIHNVIDATENQGAVIKKIHEELDNLYSETNRSKKDTIFIQADSINFIKNIYQAFPVLLTSVAILVALIGKFVSTKKQQKHILQMVER